MLAWTPGTGFCLKLTSGPKVHNEGKEDDPERVPDDVDTPELFDRGQ